MSSFKCGELCWLCSLAMYTKCACDYQGHPVSRAPTFVLRIFLPKQYGIYTGFTSVFRLCMLLFLRSLRPLVPRSNVAVVLKSSPLQWKSTMPYHDVLSPIVNQDKETSTLTQKCWNSSAHFFLLPVLSAVSLWWSHLVCIFWDLG